MAIMKYKNTQRHLVLTKHIVAAVHKLLCFQLSGRSHSYNSFHANPLEAQSSDKSTLWNHETHIPHTNSFHLFPFSDMYTENAFMRSAALCTCLSLSQQT
jgi:hypothetical protein